MRGITKKARPPRWAAAGLAVVAVMGAVAFAADPRPTPESSPKHEPARTESETAPTAKPSPNATASPAAAPPRADTPRPSPLPSGVGIQGAEGVTTAKAPKASTEAPAGLPSSLAEMDGYRLVPVADIKAATPAGDFAPPLFYEVLSPEGKPAKPGRLFVSCSCLKVEAWPIKGAEHRLVVRVRRVSKPPAAGDGFLLRVGLEEPDGVLLQVTVPK